MATVTQLVGGTLNVTTRANAPIVGTLAGDLTLTPAGTNVDVAAGKVLRAADVKTAAGDLTLTPAGANVVVATGKVLKTDTIDTAGAGDLTLGATGNLSLNPTGTDINCNNKILTNVGGIVSPALNFAQGTLVTADATPTAVPGLTLAVAQNTSYTFRVEMSLVTPGDTGPPLAASASVVDIVKTKNIGGTITTTVLNSMDARDAGLAALPATGSIVTYVPGVIADTLEVRVTGIGAPTPTNIKWDGLMWFNGVATT